MTVRTLAILSFHTSPLARPGTGDGGGMNVYVRELASSLARCGVRCEVFTRLDQSDQPATLAVEPGFTVHHVPAGPRGPVAKEDLPCLVSAWTRAVGERFDRLAAEGSPVEAIHANYWLSGLAGHHLKHQRDLPLVSTFHTLDRVKADANPEERGAAEPARRAEAEAAVIGCSDAVLASCQVEADQLIELYGATPARIEIVPPGVDRAFFAPGQQAQARRAVGLALDDPVVLFVGRIQPLKGATVALRAFSMLGYEGTGGAAEGWVGGSAAGGAAEVVGPGRLGDGAGEAGVDRAGRLRRAQLVIIGGPSGLDGPKELADLQQLIDRHGLAARVHHLPPQPHEMLSSYYRAADVCVVPSHSESFGLVALEAAACGIPVVASAVGGLTTLVDDGRTGFLVPDRDPASYARALATLLADRSLAHRFGEAGARRSRSYTWSAAAHQLLEIYQALTTRQLVACH